MKTEIIRQTTIGNHSVSLKKNEFVPIYIVLHTCCGTRLKEKKFNKGNMALTAQLEALDCFNLIVETITNVLACENQSALEQGRAERDIKNKG